MSHHLDSPEALKDTRVDICDLYVFRGERGTVFVMDTNHSISREATGKEVPDGFHPEARYEFKVDGNDDAVEDLTFRFTFGERDAAGGQTLELSRLAGIEAQDPTARGTLIASGSTGGTINGDRGLRVWTGRAGDPFWIEPEVLAAIGDAFANGTRADLSGWDSSAATNKFAGHTVSAIVLEVPDTELLPMANRDRRVGVWAMTSLATDAGGWRTINRAGHPMIHPLFAQHDGDLGDRLNATPPADDRANYGKAISGSIAAVVGAYGTAEDPQAYADAVVRRLFPNVLPYTIGTSAAYSFNDWNGRSLTDDAPVVMFSLATNTPFTIGVTKDSITAKPTTSFPYVPLTS